MSNLTISYSACLLSGSGEYNGRIYLTTTDLIFKPNIFNYGSNNPTIVIPLKQIVYVRRIIQLLRTYLIIYDSAGRTFCFHVLNRKSIINILKQANPKIQEIFSDEEEAVLEHISFTASKRKEMDDYANNFTKNNPEYVQRRGYLGWMLLIMAVIILIIL